MATILADQLQHIAKQKESTIINLDQITNKTVVLFKLKVKCNHCEALKEPTIHDFRKHPDQKCRCSRMKEKKEKMDLAEDNGWKFIHVSSGPVAEMYGLALIETYYQVSSDGQIKNAISGNILKQ